MMILRLPVPLRSRLSAIRAGVLSFNDQFSIRKEETPPQTKVVLEGRGGGICLITTLSTTTNNTGVVYENNATSRWPTKSQNQFNPPKSSRRRSSSRHLLAALPPNLVEWQLSGTAACATRALPASHTCRAKNKWMKLEI